MKPLLPAVLILATGATGAVAQTDYSTQIATDGLRATEAALAALPDLSPSDNLALGGVRFLAAVETALQTRYRTGMTDAAMMLGLPLLRLPVPENPNPEPFDAAIIEVLFQQVSTDMAGALTALDTIADDAAAGVTINTDDLWFDINMSGGRDPGEGVMDVTGLVMSGGFDAPPAGITIRFDTADAAWLSAYAHLLSGVSETVLAFHPAAAISRVLDARAAMAELAPVYPDPNNYMDMSQFGEFADIAAMVIFALQEQPDVARSRAAHAHFQAMIADNRIFWSRVAQEADDTAEWIPNKSQTSALPIPFPADTGARWQMVLSDAEALLNGDLLIPYWRLGDGAGVNLAKLFQDPPPVDIAGFVQGAALVPYMERGRTITSDNLFMFQQLMQGDSALYMIILN